MQLVSSILIHWIVIYLVDSAIHRIMQLVSLILIHWIVIYLVDSAIHRINHYPVDNAIIIGFLNTYPLDSDLSGG